MIDTSKEHFWVQVPEPLLHDKHINKTDCIIYGYIYYFATHGKDEELSWAKNKWFMDRLHISERTVNRSLDRLVLAGAITIYNRGPKQRIMPLISCVESYKARALRRTRLS